MSNGRIIINGVPKYKSHHAWFLNTGYWPDFKTKQEVIHHIDGNQENDSFENLQLMTSGEHTSLHKSGKNNPMFGIQRRKWTT